MGKGWAKGLTAATDPRIARAAEAHRGRAYRARASERPALTWGPALAYVVGLLATRESGTWTRYVEAHAL